MTIPSWGWGGHVERLEERTGAYRVLVGKPEGKKPLGRPTHSYEDNIKIGSSGSGMMGHGLASYGAEQRQVTGSCECDNELSVP